MGNEDKATRYHRLKRRAELLGTALSGLFLAALLLSGASLSLREFASMVGMAVGRGYEEAVTVVAFTAALIVLMQIIDLPLAFYHGHRLEHRYGLSNESAGTWLANQAKGGLLALLFGTAGAAIVYALIRWSPVWWWLPAAAIFALLMVLVTQLAPILLMPIFYTIKPLDRPALVERLMRLASRAGTRIGGVYEWVLSAHTNKANAALAGIGRTRRILLSDTLLREYSDDEIEVVLAHELSHHVHHDLWRGLVLQTAWLFFALYVAAATLDRFAEPLALRGRDDPAGLPLLLLAAGVCSLLFLPVANAMSRAHERRADRYALETTGLGAAFISAMKRLSQQNLAEEEPSRFVEWAFYSHPPMRARIDAARRWHALHAGGSAAATSD